MKRIVLGAALAASMLAACANEQEPGPSEADQGLASPSATTSAPSSTAADQAANPGLIAKEVGEEGGSGCRVTDLSTCDIRFTVTSLGVDNDCIPYDGLPDGQEVVRVELEAETASEFLYSASSTLLLLQDWAALGPDGFTQRNLDVAIGCEIEPGPVYKGMSPSMKERATVPLLVPAGSTALRLVDSDNTAWEWQIPR